MYRVNSVSRQIVKLLVIEQGTEHLVNLLPKNFVFTESVTDQMKILERDGVIKVREVGGLTRAAKPAAIKANPAPVAKPTMAGKLDFVNTNDGANAGPSKVSKKRR